MMSDTTLTPKFLNTRPNPMGQDLAELASSESVGCISAPIIATETVQAENLITASGDNTASWLFVSRTAVREFAKQLTDYSGNFVPNGQIYAVGPGTRSQLLTSFPHLKRIILPPKSNSESLLTLTELSKSNATRLYLVKGENGRDLLQQELALRGYDVRLVDVYRRVERQFSEESIKTWILCSVFLATSVDIATGVLNNLLRTFDDAQSTALTRTKWLVLSERIKAYLTSQGIENNLIYVCEDTDNSSIIKQIKQLAK